MAVADQYIGCPDCGYTQDYPRDADLGLKACPKCKGPRLARLEAVYPLQPVTSRPTPKPATVVAVSPTLDGIPDVDLDGVTLHTGDLRDILATLPPDSVDAIVTDPPYELSFMGKGWDGTGVAFDPKTWAACYRVLKPGGHLVAFGGTRTHHRIWVAIEDAGFEIRDTLTWLYGSGFPKSLDVSKALDKRRQDDIRPVCRFLRAEMERVGMTSKVIAERFGYHSRMVDHWAARDTDSQPTVPTWDQWQQLQAMIGFGPDMDAEVWRLNGRKGKPGDAWHERSVIDQKKRLGRPPQFMWGEEDGQRWDVTAPATDDAARWQGWGTALKPSAEPICLARKPLSEPSVAANVQRWGTGAVNVDGCRIPGKWTSWQRSDGSLAEGGSFAFDPTTQHRRNPEHPAGRWPPNTLLTHSPECKPVGTRKVKGDTKSTRGSDEGNTMYGSGKGMKRPATGQSIGYADPDGTETVEAWDCAPGCPVAELDRQSGVRPGSSLSSIGRGNRRFDGCSSYKGSGVITTGYGDTGTASRFFPCFKYQPKASRRDRTTDYHVENNHPTVKPLALMEWLITLITPPGGTVLDPFAGSGTTLIAARKLGYPVIGVELEAEHCGIILARLRAMHLAPKKPPKKETVLMW